MHSFSAEFEDIRAKARGGADRSPSKSVESEDVDSVHLGSESAHAEVEKELQPPSADESIETKPPIEPVAESIVDKLDASLKNFLEEDFITIINYFCDPPDGMEDDDQLWADLAKKVCIEITSIILRLNHLQHVAYLSHSSFVARVLSEP